MHKQAESRIQERQLQRLRLALAAFVAAATFGLAAPAQANASRIADREFAEAVQQFKQGRRSHAFGMFIALANRGDIDAARIALFMHSYGPTLWGAHWEAGEEDVEYWTTLVRNSSSAGRPQPAFEPLAVVPKGKLKQVRSSRPLVGAGSPGE